MSETLPFQPGQVRPGDVVVLGSDGLWDNLSDEQIVEEVRLLHLPVKVLLYVHALLHLHCMHVKSSHMTHAITGSFK